ncbi:hypothetical protein FSP39_019789 [Pinctada imbricata]|uniref:rRNA methyltransferase 2, mitochondrial n=1 Tax=Pinctada imbricata TaxID=66713 RepID=A0AA88Y0F4_PINIB|nr:hypothetical protein FSP39_019789 [Pinctada imbricata]
MGQVHSHLTISPTSTKLAWMMHLRPCFNTAMHGTSAAFDLYFMLEQQDKRKPRGLVIGVDLKSMEPIKGAILLSNSDFTSSETREMIAKHLMGEKLNVVLSDMAPNSSGLRHLDHQIIVKLSFSVMKFSVQTLQKNGHMVCKLWDGNETNIVKETAQKFFKTVKIVKPEASRSDSAEIYVLCKDFLLDNE